MTAQVELFDDLDAAARDAGGALGRESRPSLFDRLDWYRLVRDHAPPPGRLVVIRGEAASARGWLFLAVEGARAVAFANWYSLRFGPVLDGTAAPVVAELARGVRRAGIAQLRVSPIAEDDPLPLALKRQGWLIFRSRSTVSWRIDTSGMCFDAYWASRPSKLRNTAKRRAKAAKLDLIVYDTFDAKAWEDYESIYNASWKPAEGSPALMRALAAQEGAAGTLRLGLAYRDGQPVAAQLWLVENGVATIHKLAYREDARQHSPGTVLSMEMFRRALDVDAVAMIDFGIGDDGYKADWMSESVPLYALSAYDMRSLRGLAAAARTAAAKLVARVRSR